MHVLLIQLAASFMTTQLKAAPYLPGHVWRIAEDVEDDDTIAGYAEHKPSTHLPLNPTGPSLTKFVGRCVIVGS